MTKNEIRELIANIRDFVNIVLNSAGGTYPVLLKSQSPASAGGTDITLKEAVEIVFAAIAPILRKRGTPVTVDFAQLITPEEFRALCETYEIPYEEVKK